MLASINICSNFDPVFELLLNNLFFTGVKLRLTYPIFFLLTFIFHIFTYLELIFSFKKKPYETGNRPLREWFPPYPHQSLKRWELGRNIPLEVTWTQYNEPLRSDRLPNRTAPNLSSFLGTPSPARLLLSVPAVSPCTSCDVGLKSV